MTDTDARLIERLRSRGASEGRRQVGRTNNARAMIEAADRIESLTAELEHFIDIVDGTETTGFDPHVEQMLMDAAESARAALGDGK